MAICERRLRSESARRAAVEQHLAAFRVVETENQRKGGGFSRSGRADQRNAAAGTHDEGQVIEHLTSGREG
jgi:hypothetical protein